jgi:hypothetical protein
VRFQIVQVTEESGEKRDVLRIYSGCHGRQPEEFTRMFRNMEGARPREPDLL